jgi:NhaA family Na+:H+ antiporter
VAKGIHHAPWEKAFDRLLNPLGGIGFTMSTFIADLGFINQPEYLLMAKTGIPPGSAVAGLGGFFWLMAHTSKATAKD